MATLIRARQGALTAISPHNANRTHIIPNRRALQRTYFPLVSPGKGATDEGNGRYKLTGPSAEITFQPEGLEGRFRFYYDTFEVKVGDTTANEPTGRAVYDSSEPVCNDRVPTRYERSVGGMVSSENNAYFATIYHKGYKGDDTEFPIGRVIFVVRLCSGVGAEDHLIIGNIKIERYAG
ncbi:hypothetical protein [Tropicibacter sp. Alg240-R139]|uniref:hypothetical protein n=1 Tax=Tropicibacter sp. Alg240-R139 TaxID=2305991 RepID=UPI0013DE7F7D|nr:hypothetical protein [Tropicibacter sp. Alg240-R139]